LALALNKNGLPKQNVKVAAKRSLLRICQANLAFIDCILYGAIGFFLLPKKITKTAVMAGGADAVIPLH